MALRQRSVGGVYMPREDGIGQGVLVGATDHQLRWQGRQLPQGCQKLGRRTFEHAPTAQAEQRIATEKVFSGVKRDMAPGVPGHGYYVEPQPQCLNEFTFSDPMGGHRDARFFWRVNLHRRKTRLQFCNAADVIIVVMGQQNAVGSPSLLRCGSQNGVGLAGVDDHGAAVVGDQRPDVIVRKRG